MMSREGITGEFGQGRKYSSAVCLFSAAQLFCLIASILFNTLSSLSGFWGPLAVRCGCMSKTLQTDSSSKRRSRPLCWIRGLTITRHLGEGLSIK